MGEAGYMDMSSPLGLALVASVVGLIICVGFAMTSKSRLLNVGGYALTAALMAVFAAVVVFVQVENDIERPYKIIGVLLVAAAVWAGRNAVRAYRGTGEDGGAK